MSCAAAAGMSAYDLLTELAAKVPRGVGWANHAASPLGCL